VPNKELVKEILSHHYFDMNAEAIYNVCTDDINNLHQTIKTMMKEQ